MVAIVTLKLIQVSFLLNFEIVSSLKRCFTELSEAPPGWKIFDYTSPSKADDASATHVVRKRLFSKSSKTKHNQSSQEILTGRRKPSSIIVESANVNRNSVAVSPIQNDTTLGQKIPQEQPRKQSIQGKSHAMHNRLTG